MKTLRYTYAKPDKPIRETKLNIRVLAYIPHTHAHTHVEYQIRALHYICVRARFILQP